MQGRWWPSDNSRSCIELAFPEWLPHATLCPGILKSNKDTPYTPGASVPQATGHGVIRRPVPPTHPTPIPRPRPPSARASPHPQHTAVSPVPGFFNTDRLAGRSSSVPTLPTPLLEKTRAPSPPSNLGQSPDGRVPFPANTCRPPSGASLQLLAPQWGSESTQHWRG